jgi:hypothetical protein
MIITAISAGFVDEVRYLDYWHKIHFIVQYY